MKYLSFVVMLLLSFLWSGAATPKDDQAKLDKMCEERGHVEPSVTLVTSMYCEPYTLDFTDSTVVVYPGCNTIKYTCERCHRYVSEEEQDRRTCVWRRDISDTAQVKPTVTLRNDTIYYSKPDKESESDD